MGAGARHVGDDMPYGIRRPPWALGQGSAYGGALLLRRTESAFQDARLRMGAGYRHVGDDVPYGIRRPPCALGQGSARGGVLRNAAIRAKLKPFRLVRLISDRKGGIHADRNDDLLYPDPAAAILFFEEPLA